MNEGILSIDLRLITKSDEMFMSKLKKGKKGAI